jgi:uncharacterized protein YbbK (DUF523 family)
MDDKISIGVSSCLLGEKVRYDGGHQHDDYVAVLYVLYGDTTLNLLEKNSMMR